MTRLDRHWRTWSGPSTSGYGPSTRLPGDSVDARSLQERLAISAPSKLLERMEALGLRTGADVDAVAAAVDVVRPYVPRLGRLTA